MKNIINTNKSSKKQLKVIQGGLHDKEYAPKEFIEAYATQSRLMGAAWVYVHWKVIDSPESDNLIQFFYIDFDQYGLEDFHNFWDPRRETVKNMEHTTVDCMGSDRVYLDEEHILKLIYAYHHITLKRNYPLSDNYIQYKFILDMYEKSYQSKDLQFLSEKARDERDLKNISLDIEHILCEPIKTVNGLLTYFIMRLISKDMSVMSGYVKNKEVLKNDIFSDLTVGTLYKNEIFPIDIYENGISSNHEEKSDTESNISHFSCKSLVLCQNTYYISNLHFKTCELEILDVQLINLMKISSYEAALIISGTEYTGIYKFSSDHLPLPWLAHEFPIANFETPATNGFMYMIFKPNNSHVNNNVFLLNEDMYGCMFISYENQIILSSKHPEFLDLIRNNLLGVFNRVGMMPYLSHVESFKLSNHDGSIYDFIDSDFTDFIEFLALNTDSNL